MHFSDIQEGKSTKFTKIAIVAALHVAVAAGVIHSMDARVLSIPKVQDLVTVFVPDEIKEPPKAEPEPPKPVEKAVTPELIAPPPEVVVEQQAAPDAPAATFTSDPQPVTEPGPATATTVTESDNTGVMRTAVLADANACAKPDYPARAARNNEAGTVSLALLVGADGRVANSRVQSSSGSRDLDRAAVQALSLCKFKPATKGGVAEQAWAQIAYVWTLD
jgi:periplasmic protein TonB